MTEEEAVAKLSDLKALAGDLSLQLIDATFGPTHARLVLAYIIASLLSYEPDEEKRTRYVVKLMKETKICLDEFLERGKLDDD